MERRRRQRKRRRKAAAAEDLTSIHDVSDDLLRLILLRLDSPLWLLRAACACRQFRRAVVAGADGGRAFLRLARSLHPPAVIGRYHRYMPTPTHSAVSLTDGFVPSSSPVAASINAGRFALDFTDRRWYVADCHGGLVLIVRWTLAGNLPEEIIVCDPLTRRQQAIYHPPDDQVESGPFANAFLLDGDDGDISISNFRVLYRFCRGSWACVFSTAGGVDWRRVKQPADDGGYHHVAGRVDGTLHLGLDTGGVVAVALDNASLEFSDVDLPTRIGMSRYRSSFAVVHGASGGGPPTARIVHVRGWEMEVFRRVRHGGGGGGEWVLEHSVPSLDMAVRELPVCPWREDVAAVDVIAVGTGFAVVSLKCFIGRSRRRQWVFSVDVDTMELKEVPQETYRSTSWTLAYSLPWPRFLSACPC